MPPRPRRLTCCRLGHSRAAGTLQVGAESSRRDTKPHAAASADLARSPPASRRYSSYAERGDVRGELRGVGPSGSSPRSSASLSLQVPSSHSLNVARPRRARARSAVTPGCLDCSGPDDGLRVRDRAGRASPREHTVFCRGVWTRPTPRGPLSTRLRVFKSPAHARALLAIAGVLAATSLGQ